MRKLNSTFIALLITTCIFAQAPEKMSYQAVIRNSSNQLVTSHAIGMKISILQGSATGTPVYVETQVPTTNANGLATIEIGSGAVISGIFSTINWSSGQYFIKTETDPTGGTTYTITGVSQILSVPYALHAKTVSTFDYNYLTNKPNLFNGAWTSLTGKPTTISGYGITDAVNTFGDQTIDGSKTFIGNINAGNKNITNVATPINQTDAANKSYVDGLLDRILELQATVGVKDYDGNIYKAVKIGSQVWMAENLNTTKYRNGDEIPNITDNTSWSGLTSGAYCDYNNTPANSNVYGRLYNYYSIVDSRGLCPSGWHVPSDSEWEVLFNTLGGNAVAGGKLKEVGTLHWSSPNSFATNESGFNAIPTGQRNSLGVFESMGIYANFWTSTSATSTNAYMRGLGYNYGNIYYNNYIKQHGLSVRCVKD